MTKPSRRNYSKHRTTLSALLATVLAWAALPVLAEDNDASVSADSPASTRTASSTFSDGWRKGYIEARFLFSPHLNSFHLSAEVHGDHAVLTGQVTQGIESALAEAIAQGVDGIDMVDNRIQVVDKFAPNPVEKAANNIAAKVEDATITAKVKTALLRSKYIEGTAIDVDTSERRVILTGEVRSPAAKALAGQLANNVRGVAGVVNRLEVAAAEDKTG